jgi:hypothetical protein
MFRNATVVSYYDLQDYFAGDSWEFKRHDDGTVTAKSGVYDLKLKQKPSKCRVRIYANDDPSDSEEAETSDPVSFIKKFLSTGPESEELLKKMSSRSGIGHLPALLRQAALMLDVKRDPRDVAKVVRRGMVASFGPSLDRLFVAVVRTLAGEGDRARETEKLVKEMKEKGWKVTQSEEDGQPKMEVDVSGIYTADIFVTESVWDYTFQVQEIEESKEEGTTNDPIQQFRLFYKKDSTQDFKKQLKEKRESGKPKEDEGTVAPGKKKPDDEKTAPTARPGEPSSPSKKPAKKPKDEGTEDTMFEPTRLPPSSKADVQAWNKYSD